MLPPDTPVRRDLVGLGSSGLVYIAAADESASPALTLGAVYVEERDHDCLPSSTRACRYLLHLARFRAGSFSMFDEDFSGVQVFNVDPFEVVMGGGGPSSLSSPIPSNVLFAVFAEGHNKAFSAFPASHSSITVDPSGGGMVAMNASLHTTIDGTGVDFDFSFVADSPLANRQSPTGGQCRTRSGRVFLRVLRSRASARWFGVFRPRRKPASAALVRGRGGVGHRSDVAGTVPGIRGAPGHP